MATYRLLQGKHGRKSTEQAFDKIGNPIPASRRFLKPGETITTETNLLKYNGPSLKYKTAHQGRSIYTKFELA